MPAGTKLPNPLPPPTRDLEGVKTEFVDGNLTAGRHNYYGTLYLGDVAVGGMQAWSLRETNGTQFIPNAGNDWLEPRFGMRMWQGQGSRFMIRGSDIQEITRQFFKGAPGTEGKELTDIDFRFLPFNWLFHFNMKTFGAKPIENSSWHVATVWITEYTWKYTSPFDLLYEDFSFIAKGMRRAFSTGHLDMGNDIHLWGNPAKPIADGSLELDTAAAGIGGEEEVLDTALFSSLFAESSGNSQ